MNERERMKNRLRIGLSEPNSNNNNNDEKKKCDVILCAAVYRTVLCTTDNKFNEKKKTDQI